MFNLQPLRHISTLLKATVGVRGATCRDGPIRDILLTGLWPSIQ
jgi:hypothetical protein